MQEVRRARVLIGASGLCALSRQPRKSICRANRARPRMSAPEDAIQQALCPILVGRAEELRIFDAGLAAARRQQGRAYVLAGDAGIGKTRLAVEVRDRAAKYGMLTLWGACSQAELALPYLPIVQALGGYLATTDLDWIILRPSLVYAEGAFGGTALFRALATHEIMLLGLVPSKVSQRLMAA